MSKYQQEQAKRLADDIPVEGKLCPLIEYFGEAQICGAIDWPADVPCPKGYDPKDCRYHKE